MYQESSHDSDDALLLLQLSQGSEHAFEILYNRYWKEVYNHAYKTLNDQDYAEAITGDVFLQLESRDAAYKIDNLLLYLLEATKISILEHIKRQV